MKLTEYFESQGRGSASRLAAEIDAYHSDVSDWTNGKRPIPVKFAVAIEISTAGIVSRKDLFPDDWRAIWPELTTSAPADIKVGATNV